MGIFVFFFNIIQKKSCKRSGESGFCSKLYSSKTISNFQMRVLKALQNHLYKNPKIIKHIKCLLPKTQASCMDERENIHIKYLKHICILRVKNIRWSKSRKEGMKRQTNL